MDICGNCGNSTGDPSALCSKCGEDFWVQPEDFNTPDLALYIEVAARNLGLTVEQLRSRVLQKDTQMKRSVLNLTELYTQKQECKAFIEIWSWMEDREQIGNDVLNETKFLSDVWCNWCASKDRLFESADEVLHDINREIATCTPKFFHRVHGYGDWVECPKNGNHEVIMDLVDCEYINKETAWLHDVPDGTGDYKVVFPD